jgi:5-methylcytosine-specific restriction endonuclease McrA
MAPFAFREEEIFPLTAVGATSHGERGIHPQETPRRARLRAACGLQTMHSLRRDEGSRRVPALDDDLRRLEFVVSRMSPGGNAGMAGTRACGRPAHDERPAVVSPSRRPCLERGVPFHLSEPGKPRCAAHMKPWDRRPAPDQRYTGTNWRKMRARVIREEPICQLRFPGCTGRSVQVDHIVSANDRPDLFLVRSNLRGLCAACHFKRSAEQARARRRGRR